MIMVHYTLNSVSCSSAGLLVISSCKMFILSLLNPIPFSVHLYDLSFKSVTFDVENQFISYSFKQKLQLTTGILEMLSAG